MSRRASLLQQVAWVQGRQAQIGVNASKGYLSSTAPGLLFDGPRSMECFFNLRQSDGTQRPAQFSTSMIAIAVTPMDMIMFHCGNKSLQVSRVTIGDDIHAVISYDGATAMCYINGIEVGAMQPTAYTPSALFRIGDPLHITKSPVHFCRHFNYALSAEEVVALYNNGDPMGYVVPKAMRGLEPVEITGSNSYTWTGVDSVTNVGIKTNPNIEYGKFYVVNISVSDYEAGSPYLYIGYSYGIPKVNGNYNILIEHQYQSSNTILLFGGPDGTDRRLTLTVNSITPVGLLAEYLPQNLMGSRKESIGFTHFSTQNPYTFPGGVSKTMYCYLTRRYILGEGLKMRVKVSDYQSGVTTCVLGNVYHTIPSANGEYEFFSVSKLSPDDPASNYAMIYGSGAMTIEVLSIESVTVLTSWLDSAKKLPLNDEYLPPLLQSDGGYDLSLASGVVDVVYKTQK